MYIVFSHKIINEVLRNHINRHIKLEKKFLGYFVFCIFLQNAIKVSKKFCMPKNILSKCKNGVNNPKIQKLNQPDMIKSCIQYAIRSAVFQNQNK